MKWEPIVFKKRGGRYWYSGVQRDDTVNINWSIPLIDRKTALKYAQLEARDANMPKLVETCTGDRLVAPQ